MSVDLRGTDARLEVGVEGLPQRVDVLVVGLGVTGAGAALDAASRGLSVLAVDAHDVAWGTSRWSSKLVHGGLRYLAHGQVGVAHESAVERGILMTRTAPHLTHTLPTLVPLHDQVGSTQGMLAMLGTRAGNLLRMAARTPTRVLPPPARISAVEAAALAPGLRRRDLRGAVLGFDGQLEDDARLVIGIARTAAAEGAVVRTRVRADDLTGFGARLTDEATGASCRIEARAVINATGVWAAGLVDGLALTPSRGSHLVVRGDRLALRAAVMIPVPGSTSRFCMLLPQPDGDVYVGLTDAPVEGPIPDVPVVPEEDQRFLLDVVNRALEVPLTDEDVVGRYAGLRPLLAADGASADLSRRHAILTSETGVVTVVGGKLTTYRRMAQDAVDAVVSQNGLVAGHCVTSELPLLGSLGFDRESAKTPDRLARRFGTEAELVLANAREVSGLSDEELLTPVGSDVPVTPAELIFGVTHEGARSVADLLERRTRVALVPDRIDQATPAAEHALALLQKVCI